jgi:pilus assembly protein CpaB
VQPDPRGQAINAPVVTLLVSPEHAEVLTLAGNEAKIQLVLRNGSDNGVTSTPGRKLHELYRTKAASGKRSESDNEDSDSESVRRRPRPRPVVVAQAAPPPPVAVAPPPPPVPDQIVVIRGNQKTVEVVGNARVGRN